MLNIGNADWREGQFAVNSRLPGEGANPPQGMSFTPGIPRTVLGHAAVVLVSAPMRMRGSMAMAALLTVAQLAAAAPARAERPAASLEKSGEVKFDAEDYQGALADFTAARKRRRRRGTSGSSAIVRTTCSITARRWRRTCGSPQRIRPSSGRG